MAETPDWPTPPTVLTIALAIAVIGVVLYFVLPVIGTAIGLAVAVSKTGLSTAGVVSAWVAPVASAGVAVIGVTFAVRGIKKVSEAAQDKPYEWGLPLLAVFAGFMSTLVQDTVLPSNALKWVFAGVTALLIVIAGACYKLRGARWKGMAITLYLLPPVALLGWSTAAAGRSSVVDSFRAVNKWTWIGVGSILLIGVLIGLLAHLEEGRRRGVA